jgi:hypothetical protein
LLENEYCEPLPAGEVYVVAATEWNVLRMAAEFPASVPDVGVPLMLGIK